jgi:replicative DNA helicase Mcm
LAAEYTDEDLLARWEEFFETADYRSKVIDVSDHYPEQRSVNVSYSDLDQFDPDMADYLLQHPNKVLWNGEQTIKKFIPPSREGAEIHLRIIELPRDSRVEIRKLRSKHLGKFLSVEGLVRKATEVRPKITAAFFQCMRCHAIIKEPQEGMFFKEPLECYKEQDGCGRSAGTTKFKLLTEDSHYVDTQKIEIQESPEGLRGGAQPERLVGYLEDDIAGKIFPGYRVILNGILHSVQKGPVAKSTLFDINLDIVSVEFQEHEYEEILIEEEDKQKILAEAKSPDIFNKIIASISPTIYGYDVEKEAIALQLFGGVSKELDDGTRIRGDIHVLLVGDPGVAKCVTGDAEVMMPDGSVRRIRQVVDEALRKNGSKEVDDGVYADVDIAVMTFSSRGVMETGRAIRVWKRRAPKRIVKLRTKEGRNLTVTPTHPLFVQNANWITPRSVSKIPVGTCIAVALGPGTVGADHMGGAGRGLDWDELVSKEEIPTRAKWVYDLEVEETHNFVTNTIISHNSQLLRYMAELAPRGIYASGKGSSAAGLCVAPDTRIEVDGKEVRIGEFAEERLTSPSQVKRGVWRQETNSQKVASMTPDGGIERKNLKAIWRIDTPSFLVELEGLSGERISLTPETRLMARSNGGTAGWVRASDVAVGDRLLSYASGTGGSPGSSGNARWVEVTCKKNTTADLPPHVYDLTVEDSHAFVANGFLVHNTAAAVKDDFGEGRWTLEAGALVLADKGLAAVDELDKMEDYDRSAMHEAMESQTVTVAKAGITATLQCRCSILGAANPKYGRFEEHQLIADQINLPPVLLSRFDLIFAMTDKPDAELDAKITDHILMAHRRGQIRRYADPSEVEGLPVERIIEETSVMAPIFSREFFRKYVAYSKRFTPVLTDEAMKIIHDYYLRIRKQGEPEGSSVPITARQLEAFVRLSEASARVRLSGLVTPEDANRAVRIVEYYLSKIAREAGRFDIDIITTGTSKSQREQISVLRKLISDMADQKKGVAIEMLVQNAEAEGIPEDRVMILLKRLSTSGEVYSPSPGYYKLASEG